ncbi:hypothetical protein VTH82DRAFT_169 [Thermothelomyces myriococcoides]
MSTPTPSTDRYHLAPNPVVSLDPSIPLEPRPLIADILRTRYCVPGSVFLVESIERCIPIPDPDDEDGHGGDGSGGIEGAAEQLERQQRRRRSRESRQSERTVRLLLGDGELCIQAFVRGEIHGFVDGGSVYEGCYVRVDRFWLGEELVEEEEEMLDDEVGDPEVLERQMERRQRVGKKDPGGKWKRVVYLVVDDMVTVGWNEEYLRILRREREKTEKREKEMEIEEEGGTGQAGVDGVVSPTKAMGNYAEQTIGEEMREFEDDKDDKIIEKLIAVETGGQTDKIVVADGAATAYTPETSEAASAKPVLKEKPDRPDDLSDSDSAFETLAVSPQRVSQRRAAVTIPSDPQEELKAAIIKQNQEHRHGSKGLSDPQPHPHQPQPQSRLQPQQQSKPQAVTNPRPWLPTDATKPVRLTPLSQIPHLPYRQNWMVNVLVVVTSVSDVEPSYIAPSFRQRTARLSDMSTPKQVHLSVYLDPEEFTPAEGSAVLLLGVKNHLFDGGSLRKYVSDRLPRGQSWWVADPGELTNGPSEMAKVHKKDPVTVEAVIGVAKLGIIIFGFLYDVNDLRNVALMNKRFYNAAQPHLWATITIPYLQKHPRSHDPHAFWDRFLPFLKRHSFSLCAKMQTMAPRLYKRLMAKNRHWEFSSKNSTRSVVKRDVDELFSGLRETLARAERLRSFSARGVPRVLDLLILLQRYRAEVQCVSITASKRDTFGLLSLPARDVHHWRQKVWLNPRIAVPLVNSVNFGPDTNVIPVFSFPNLRILSLHNLQYDNQYPSPYFDNLVALLKGSPGLLNANHPMRSLCLQYQRAGGKPLRLRALTLGYGFELVDNSIHSSITPGGVPHCFAYLIDLGALEGLHLESIHDKDETHLHRPSSSLGFPLISSTSVPHARCLTGLRKITWPWKEGLLLKLLADGDEQHLSKLVLRTDTPSPQDWGEADGRRTWLKPKLFTHAVENATGPLLRGLVLPAESMTPQDGQAFLASFPRPWLDALESLKVQMPPLVAGENTLTNMRELRDKLVKMQCLRHLWLADGLGTSTNGSSPLVATKGRYVPESYPAEYWFRTLSAPIAARWCPQPVYLRILDGAWYITDRRKYAILREVPWDCVDKDLPDDFFLSQTRGSFG